MTCGYDSRTDPGEKRAHKSGVERNAKKATFNRSEVAFPEPPCCHVAAQIMCLEADVADNQLLKSERTT